MHDMIAPRSNEAWIAALRGRGPETTHACAQLLTYLRRLITRCARGRLAAADIDEIVHDSLVRIVVGLAGYRGESSFLTWAAAVAWRVVIDEFRRRERRSCALRAFAQLAAPSPQLRPDDALAQADLVTALERAIATSLSDRQRLAIVGELTGEQSTALAEHLGITPNALYKLTHDARRKLRLALLASSDDALPIND